MPSPTWYRTARTLNGNPWVPFQIAQALQAQVEEQHQRLAWAEQALAESQRHVRAASSRLQADSGWQQDAVEPLRARVQALEDALVQARAQVEGAMAEAARFRVEAEQARDDASAAATRLAELSRQDRAAEEADPRLVELKADLANVRRHVQDEIARGVRDERVARLQGLLEVHDDLLRSLHYQTDIRSPWYQGHAAILKRTEAELRRAGASPVGGVGEPFDPQRHEALALRPAEGRPSGTVASVEQVGFALEDGTLVRPARVVVVE